MKRLFLFLTLLFPLSVTAVGQALQGSVPGLYLNPRTGRGDYSSVSIQGSRSEDVLWLVDGVPVNNRLFGGTSPLDSISTHMIQRIEVLKGGQGLFYGSQAIAGVVNIVLRKPTKAPEGDLTGAVGTLGDRRLAGHVSNSGYAGRWLVFGEQDQSEGYSPYRDDAYQPNARKTRRGFNRRSVGGRYHLPVDEDRSLRVFLIRNDVEADNSRPANNLKSVNERDEHIASVKWDHQVTEQTGYVIKGYIHDWWSDWTRLGMDTDGNASVLDDQTEWGFEDYGLNLTGRHTLGNGSELLGGIDYQHYRGKDAVVGITSLSETVSAGFIQYRPRLAFSPEAHLGTNFRLPTANELFSEDQDGPDGNDNLEPETSLNANLTLKGPLGPSIQWRLGGFYREIEDLIGQRDGQYINTAGTTRVRGGEAGCILIR